MSDTYTQLYIQLVFSVKNRQNFIQHRWKDQLYKYITSVIQHDSHKMLAINGMPDHTHIFFGLNPAIGISDVVKDVKRATNNWINNNKLVTGTFAWQTGYGAFSYSHSHIHQVCNYIEKQEHYHAKISFKEEYTAFLKASILNSKMNICLNFMIDPTQCSRGLLLRSRVVFWYVFSTDRLHLRCKELLVRDVLRENAKMWKCENAKMQKCKNAKMQKCENVKM